MVQDIINKFSSDYKVIVVGDATMAPYEITNAGGSIEHWNEESGATWLERLTSHFDSIAWLNPESKSIWNSSASNKMIREIFEDKMFEMNLSGIEEAMKDLQGQNETLERQIVQSGIQEKINEGTRQINKELDSTIVEQQKLRDGMKNVVDLTKKELALEKKKNSVDNKEK